MDEIPLIFPDCIYAPRRYILDVDAKQLEQLSSDVPEQEQQPSASPSGTNTLPYLQSVDEALLGAASVSSVMIRGQEFLVVTSASVDESHVIRIALSWKKNEDALDSPTIIELDTKDLQVVAIRAFSNCDDDKAITVVLVGCRGTIVSFSLDGNLQKENGTTLKVLHREDYIPTSLLEQVKPSDLRHNMISFLPCEKRFIIVALAPLILTVDWMVNASSSIWSEIQCLDDMATRSDRFTGMITTLPRFILGKVDRNIVDMAPTAAICVSADKTKSSDPDEDVSAVLVFTLHSDASIRKWLIEPERSMSPIEVSKLETSKISPPALWSGSMRSVSLSARVYERTFALAVYIKTNTLSSFNDGVSDCNIWVFDGLDTAQGSHNCLVMKVPPDAVSLVGMSFLPFERRCTLSVVFEASVVRDAKVKSNLEANRIKIINYPPSLFSIVSCEPHVVATRNLDQFAATELERIRSLSFGSVILSEIEDEAYDVADNKTEESISVDLIIDKLDSLYTKYLFRPVFPRGNGTVLPPPEICIRHALSKLVHGAIKDDGMSMELETIKTLHEWRNRDKRKTSSNFRSKFVQTPDKTSNRTAPCIKTNDINLSVYDSFVEAEEDPEGAIIVTQGEYDEFEEVEERIIAEVKSHESRWKRLLLQVWEEELIRRSPLCTTWLESIPVQILVRSSVTTVLLNNDLKKSNNFENWKVTLQEASRNILELVEADEDKLKSLYSIEDHLIFLLSSAQIAHSSQSTIREELTSLGRWARLQEKHPNNTILRKLVTELSDDDLVRWIEDRPTDLGTFEKEVRQAHFNFSRKSSNRCIAKAQLRHTSCSLAVRAVDSIRRSRLSKCLLFLELGVRCQISLAAFRAYIQSIAILWISAQRIEIPDTVFETSTGIRSICFEGDNPRSISSSINRFSLGNTTYTTSVPSRNGMSTTLDIVMMNISQAIKGPLGEATPFSAMNQLCEAFVDLIFSSKKTETNDAHILIPELRVLPISQDKERTNDHPDLALRLLSPFVAFQIRGDLPESVWARKEELSSCLLHAAQSRSFSASRKSLMRKMASDLLVPKTQDSINPSRKVYTKEGLNALKSMQTKRISNSVQDLTILMHSILPQATSAGIVRLCGLSTARYLFSSFTSNPNANLDDINSLYAIHIAKLLLCLSQNLHRLNILEKYVTKSEFSDNGDSCNFDSLLQIVSDTIDNMEANFPEEFLKTMPEYISIWSKKFDHAVRACQWSQAYNACVKNPLDAHRESNFKRLIRAMVDSGALDMLLDMCTQLVVESSELLASMDSKYENSQSVDLYEIASDVLLIYADCDVYNSRATSVCNKNMSDYQGALYALHASQGQWRRAAQSLDLRYVNAEKALRRATGKSGINIQTSELRDGLIIQDLVLSACGSANAIQLVKDPDYRFIVSGEYGKLSVLHFCENSNLKTPDEVNRSRSAGDDESTKESARVTSRLSTFMVKDHLDCRGIRSAALRALFFDTSTNYAFAKLAFKRNLDASKSDIDELFKNGYYQYGLLLSRAWCKVFSNYKSKPGGENVFGSCLSLLMGKYLVPFASLKNNRLRPTLQQLQNCIDAAAAFQSAASYVVDERSLDLASLEKGTIISANFALVEKLAKIHSTAEIPLSLHIAIFYLEDGYLRKLPVWLERLLLGIEDNASGGGFAIRKKARSNSYHGNPSALLQIYTHRGMFADACRVVACILDDNDRAARAASRLPEKGNIDYVPYNSIDFLWNLIETVHFKGVYTDEEMCNVLKARELMEKAFKKHLEWMQVSEVGIRSARVLNE